MSEHDWLEVLSVAFKQGAIISSVVALVAIVITLSLAAVGIL